MLQRLRELFDLGSDLAIDLGTANTLVGVAGEGLVINEPSVVAVPQAGGQVSADGCAIGHVARQMLGRAPESISVVRPMRDGVITDFELCEAMLRYFMRKAQRRRWSLRPRVLVAVPGSITPVEKRAVYNSLYRAGAGQVLLIGEAQAAALGAGLPIAEATASMVCDIGGGTTEVAILSMTDVVASASVRVACDAMDAAVVDYLRQQHNLCIGLPMAEWLRIEIGSAAPLEQELADEVRGIDAVSRLPRRATITSEEIRAALSAPLERIVAAIKGVLDQVSPDLAADLVDQGMTLCGGGALTRGLDRFLSERTGMPVRVTAEPLLSVAKGAQICLENLPQWRKLLESSHDDV
ncbi:MAG TPA: rod shape-determining protein [Pirellulales bacterium]|nr:rod shape-determining protein [Pirellulales bacterium]